MNIVDNESSLAVNIEIQVIQNVIVSHYFTAAGLAIALYDTILTMEDELSEIWKRVFKLIVLTLLRFAWFGQGLSNSQSYFTTSTVTGQLRP